MNKNRTILYVEDDTVVLTVYHRCLHQAGFDVVTARDGLEAIKQLSTITPDLVLLDLVLPKFTGEAVLQFIRASKTLATVPVIVLSTNSVSDAAQEHLLESAGKRIIKSLCTPAVLLAAVQEVLSTADVSMPENRGPVGLPKQIKKIRTILYVEDDPIVLTAHQVRLQQSGFHVIPARDGLEAIRRLSAFVPDLVLLDLLLPKFSGENVLEFIRSSPALAKVPVIILSTNSVLNPAHETLLERARTRLLKSQCTAKTLLAAIQEVAAG